MNLKWPEVNIIHASIENKKKPLVELTLHLLKSSFSQIGQMLYYIFNVSIIIDH